MSVLGNFNKHKQSVHHCGWSARQLCNIAYNSDVKVLDNGNIDLVYKSLISLLYHTFHRYSPQPPLQVGMQVSFLPLYQQAADLVCISSLHLHHKECYCFVMGCVGVAGHDCERTARRGGRQCMAPPPQAGSTGNTPLHIWRWRPHSLCGQSKPVVHLVPDNHLMHLYFIDLIVCKQMTLPFYMQS